MSTVERVGCIGFFFVFDDNITSATYGKYQQKFKHIFMQVSYAHVAIRTHSMPYATDLLVRTYAHRWTTVRLAI